MAYHAQIGQRHRTHQCRRGPPGSDQNTKQRQTEISVIRSDSFDVRLRTQAVRLLGSNELRDVDADGDEALLRIDGGFNITETIRSILNPRVH